jgi:hypothetical protein
VVGISEKIPPRGLAHGADNVIKGSHIKLIVKKFNLKFVISSKVRGLIALKDSIMS